MVTVVSGDPLVPYLIRHGLAGTLAGWLTVTGLLALDVGGLNTLVLASDLFPIPLIMLFWVFGLTFASLAMGAGVMALARAEPREPAAARPAAAQGPQSAAAAPPAPPRPAARRR
jgi:hypothetical protein